MKRFYFVCEFMKKDPENLKEAMCLERHVFVFVIREDADPEKNRLCEWCDPSISMEETEDS